MFSMEESSGFDEVSSSGLETTPGATTSNSQDLSYPTYLTYLSLGFKWTTTTMILLMATWVFSTIKNTRSLHKPHNIFVACLMITGVVSAVIACLQSSLMMISFLTGLGDFISCSVFKFLLFPANEVYFMYVVISVDKVIAIRFPYKYKNVMTKHTIGSIIITTWLWLLSHQLTSYWSLMALPKFLNLAPVDQMEKPNQQYIESCTTHLFVICYCCCHQHLLSHQSLSGTQADMGGDQAIRLFCQSA